MPVDDGTFVPLARILRPEPVREPAPPPIAVTVACEPPPLPDVTEFARDVRVFRARLADAFDRACDELLRESGHVDARLAARLAALLDVTP